MFFIIRSTISGIQKYELDKFHWAATFNGNSRLEYQMDQLGMQAESRHDVLQLRFRSKKPNGLIFYAASTLGIVLYSIASLSFILVL